MTNLNKMRKELVDLYDIKDRFRLDTEMNYMAITVFDDCIEAFRELIEEDYLTCKNHAVCKAHFESLLSKLPEVKE